MNAKKRTPNSRPFLWTQTSTLPKIFKNLVNWQHCKIKINTKIETTCIHVILINRGNVAKRSHHTGKSKKNIFMEGPFFSLWGDFWPFGRFTLHKVVFFCYRGRLLGLPPYNKFCAPMTWTYLYNNRILRGRISQHPATSHRALRVLYQ